MADAVVVGAGPNGLVAANLLADAGWDVLVLEAEAEPGGAVRSGETTRPGFVHDRFSSFYPLVAASPVMQALELERHGLRLCRAEAAVAHPLGGGRAAAIYGGDLDRTCAGLEALAPGDGEAFARWMAYWKRIGPGLIEALMSPFPPLRGALKLGAALRTPRRMGEMARLGMLPVRRFVEEEFAGEGPALLFAGNALHADFAPETAGGGIYGLVLVGMAQEVGYPVAEGGSRSLTAALVRRLGAAGGRIECGARAERILLRGGRAAGVRTADGREHPAARAVLADVGAPQLFGELVGPEHLPPRAREGLRRFQYDHGTVKVDWALSGPVPWEAPEMAHTGTVHVAESVDALTLAMARIAMRQIPERPFLVAGQYARMDPTRQPAGAETFWGYTHVPRDVRGDAGGDDLRGTWDEREREAMADRMEAELERFAPGFRDRVLDRHVSAPPDLEAADANLVGGAINGGTAQLHQQLVLRPFPGLGRAATPVPRLFLASASAHPGGGVHGACGANAARAALHGRWAADARRVGGLRPVRG
jgi:phytoene dehydrogenase-like protein